MRSTICHNDDDLPDWMTCYTEVELKPRKPKIIRLGGTAKVNAPVPEELDESDEDYYGCGATVKNKDLRSCIFKASSVANYQMRKPVRSAKILKRKLRKMQKDSSSSMPSE